MNCYKIIKDYPEDASMQQKRNSKVVDHNSYDKNSSDSDVSTQWDLQHQVIGSTDGRGLVRTQKSEKTPYWKHYKAKSLHPTTILFLVRVVSIYSTLK